jgi:AcrR family transcriptional regulator
MAYRQTDYTRKKTEASRRGLLLAALKLFTNRGYRSTSMQQVVKAAGTSIGNAYFYFKNKEDLLNAVVQHSMTIRFRSIDALARTEPLGVGRLAINAYCSVLAPFSGGFVAKGAFEARDDSTFLDALMNASMDRMEDLLEENLPNLETESACFAANAWCGMACHLLRARARGELKGEPETLAQQVVVWQLRALGMADEQIEEGLDAVRRARESDAWDEFLATVPHSESDLDRLVLEID